MRIHLVDATYELFRAHYAPRPPVHGRDGILLSGVSGLVEQLCFLLREQGATHVGAATDRVIESFRNDLYPGYKSSAGMPADLLAQFPIAEAAIEALGVVLWPMVEWEADDAIAAAAHRFEDDPRVEQIVVCTPDKDMAQLVDGEHVVLWDRRRDITYDEPAVVDKWGVRPASVPDRLALVGDASDGFPGLPGWGDKAAAAVLSVRPSRGDPGQGVGVGRAGAGRRSRSPRRSATGSTRPCSIATWRRSGRSTTGSASRRPMPRSCAGRGARSGDLGGGSATGGASIDSARGPIAGAARAVSSGQAASRSSAA